MGLTLPGATVIVTGPDLSVRRWLDGDAPLVRIADGSSLAEVLPPDQRDATVDRIHQAIRDAGVFAAELPCRTAAGDFIAVRASVVAIAEGANAPNALAVVLSAPRPPSESEPETYRRMVDSASEAILVAQDGRIRFANPECARALGQSAEALTSTPFIQFIHPDDRALVLDRHVRRLAGEQQPQEYSFRAIDAAGGTRWLEIRAVLTTWEGRPATLNFLQDVTLHKTVLAEKVQLQERLDQSQEIESLGRLAGGVAHDMNNVLAAIMGFVSVWKDELKDNQPLANDIEDVLKACERGRDLARNLLGFARQGTYTMEPVSLNSIVRQIERLLRHTLSKNVTVRAHLDPELPMIHGDSSQLSHALMNLCVNAADAMPSGGSLTLATRRSDGRNLDLGQPDSEEGPYAVIEVVDTGCGMSPETMERAFEPFFTTKPKGQGTGLGLAMVQGTVQSHGGSVRLDSELSGGTMVTMVFPSTGRASTRLSSRPSPPPSTADGPRPPVELPRQDAGTILVVDDEATVRRATTRLLERLGCTVVAVESGEKAIEAITLDTEARVALVLLDLVMPGLDGAETFRRLRRIRPALRVLLCSGYSREQWVQGLLNSGAVGFLRKPYRIEQLSEAIDAAMAGPKAPDAAK